MQDPSVAFSPQMRISEAVAEPLVLDGMTSRTRRREIVTDLLERVGLSAGDADRYPHEFSGGQKQRLAIARALVTNLDVIAADEPTSALDSRVQSDVLGLLDRIRREHNIAVLLVTHDIDVIQLFCDRDAVMYLGKIVERGEVDTTLQTPAHPHTQVLLGSVPALAREDPAFTQPLTETIPQRACATGWLPVSPRCPEIVPPDNVKLSDEEWQPVGESRLGLQAGKVPDQVVGAELDRLRSVFGLPATVSDENVETVVDEALAMINAGELDTAADQMPETVTTICEHKTPSGRHSGPPVRCHRYDEDTEATTGK